MNRQVLPSMLLSVFIVCFFAVVLRPVEPIGGQTAADPSRAAPTLEPIEPPAVAVDEVVKEAEAAPLPSADPMPTPVAQAETTPEPPPEPAPYVATTAAVGAAPPAETSAPAPAPRPPNSPEPAPVVHVAPRVVSSPPAPRLGAPAEVRIASTPAPRRSPAPPPAPVPDPPAKVDVPAPAPAKEVEMMTIPRGEPESTVAAAGETLEDVALRVYGSRAAVATLRDANRGLVGRLRPGTLLWTPPL